ncbi:uncharacterized protein EDB91DRAFT_1247116 [Suillus paluster]|uniref:uncharacterized protein n=1 Tax=Suillus paluster TaxID=48578 RepID=UPI001B867084|nr:uncharacterized protein EDB91DRAFT_1247116 [Suillus paluster]KAG1743616.1 hypothetical protein EDB91DRAFT_1247116 [Suillus paluster]
MSVNNIDIDMQHPEFQPEDVQTSHDTDLFGDDEDDDKGAGDFVDALSQPPTSVPRLNKRARDEVISGKHHFREFDYLQILRQTVYEQQEHINNIIQETEAIHREAQDHIEEQQCIAEEERECHMHDFNEQWEAALREREREKQEIHTWQEQQQALLRKNIAEELARCGERPHLHSATIPLPICIFPEPSATRNQAEPSRTKRNPAEQSRTTCIISF